MKALQRETLTIYSETKRTLLVSVQMSGDFYCVELKTR